MAVNLLLNNLVNDSIKYISFSDLPNIITLEDDADTGARKAQFTFRINATSLAGKDDGTYSIELFGETITSVKNYDNAVNKNFFISPSSNGSTAASIANALRNCQSIAANYLIENDANIMVLTARRYFETDIQSNYFIYENGVSNPSLFSNFILTNYTDGQEPSELSNARVSVDIYSGDSHEYVTRLEKVCPEKKVQFNISPVITSIAEYGTAAKYSYKVSYIKSNGEYVDTYKEDDYINYVVPGGDIWEDKVPKEANQPLFAMPYEKGDAWIDVQNHTLYYLYSPIIHFSYFRGYLSSPLTISYDFLDSAFQSLTNGSGFTQMKVVDNDTLFFDMNLNLITGDEPARLWEKAFYVNLSINGVTIRYNVIKPLKAAEGSTKLLWRNRYGGISFFEFTSKKTESSSIENQLTYYKNIYDYYDDEFQYGDEKVYGKDVQRSLTLKSHLIEENAKYLFQDLERTKKAWILTSDDKKYDVIVDSVQFDEIDNNNNLFEATVRLHYAMNF